VSIVGRHHVLNYAKHHFIDLHRATKHPPTKDVTCSRW